MANGKITATGATIGALVGGFLGNVVETAANVTGKALKKGAELSKKGLEESRKALATGLEKTGEAISDEGIAARKVSKANKVIQNAEKLKAKYHTKPEVVPASEASRAVIISE